MADIFISYSKSEPEPTKQLAATLEALGYSVWWDTSLLPVGEFPDEIKTQLQLAKAVIVIWSQGAVQSQWVKGEAEFARRDGKLINCRTDTFDVNDLPVQLTNAHCELWSNTGAIVGAVKRLVEANSEPAKVMAGSPTPVAKKFGEKVQRSGEVGWYSNQPKSVRVGMAVSVVSFFLIPVALIVTQAGESPGMIVFGAVVGGTSNGLLAAGITALAQMLTRDPS